MFLPLTDLTKMLQVIFPFLLHIIHIMLVILLYHLILFIALQVKLYLTLSEDNQ